MKFRIAFILCLVQGVSFGQNIPRYAQLNFAQGINNPAAIALDAKMMADIMYRNQWYQFEGAPKTYAFNGQYELFNDMAVGLNFHHDRIGAVENNMLTGQYAYRLVFNQNNALIFGLGLGIDQRSSDLAGASLVESNDPAFAQGYSKTFFQSSFGMYYYSPTFYAGLSLPQMFQHNFGQGDGFNAQAFQYYFSTGFFIEAGENYTFNPNIQVKAGVNMPLQGDLVLRNTLYGRFSLVAGYRTENSLIAGMDVLITPFVRAGYSFNYDIGSLSRIKGMSNELYLGLAFPYRNSRYDFGSRQYISRKGKFHRDYRGRNKRRNKVRKKNKQMRRRFR